MATMDDRGDPQRLLALWFGMLGPPVIWGIRFGVSYALVPYACARAGVMVLQLVTLVALLGTAWAGVVAGRHWRATGKSTQVELGGPEARARFMALFGLLSSALFFLVMAAEGLAVFFIDPCQTGGVPL